MPAIAMGGACVLLLPFGSTSGGEHLAWGLVGVKAALVPAGWRRTQCGDILEFGFSFAMSWVVDTRHRV